MSDSEFLRESKRRSEVMARQPDLEAAGSMPKVAGWRVGLAFVVALLADTVAAVPLGEGAPIVFDGIVGFTLLVLLGFEVALIPALVLEMVPGVGLFPCWTVAVAKIAADRR